MTIAVSWPIAWEQWEGRCTKRGAGLTEARASLFGDPVGRA